MLNEQFEELKHTGQLPTPSGVGMRILVLTQQPDCPVDELVEVISADPALTGKIIKLATSVQLSGQVTISSVKEAAMRLGTRTVSNVALGFTLVAGNRSGRCMEFDYDRYWSWSLANAVAAQVISRVLEVGHSAEAFTCALLARIGQLALASVHPKDYAEVLTRFRRDPKVPLIEIEREHFRIHNREITEAMLEDWGLPTSFSEATGALDETQPPVPLTDAKAEALLKILHASCRVADVCVAEREQQPEFLPGLKVAAEVLGISEEKFARIYDQVVPDWRMWGEFLKVPTNKVATFEELGRKGTDGEGTDRAAGGDALRILAVDDDPVSLKLLVRHLESAGHLVVTATNGTEALAVALEANPQIVVTDWMMPEMDGIELCKTLRQYGAGRNLYILILTGRAEEDRIVEAFDAGVDDYIVKPFKPKLLLARIRGGQRVVRLQEQVERDKMIRQEQVSKLGVLTRKLQAAAMTDQLTDLPNRRYAMKRLEMEWANSLRSEQPFSVLMMDIDHFKLVNDNFGHAVGNDVLHRTARTIHRTLRRGDVCARMGGEEFLVICPNTNGAAAENVAERIRENVENNIVKDGGFNKNVTISIGVATRGPGIDSIDALLKVSDDAVYEAKRRGRNQVVRAVIPKLDRDSA